MSGGNSHIAFNDNNQLVNGNMVYNVNSGKTDIIKFPGSIGTTVTGINNHGIVVGTFRDSTGSHGFVA